MPTDTPDSSPTTPTDAIDNDGEDTSPPVRPAPSPSTGEAAPATTGTTAPPPSAETGRDVAPRVGPELPLTEVGAFVWLDKPETKKERAARLKLEAKARTNAANVEAWSTCCQHWQTISGRLPAMTPDAGMGLSLMEAIERDGAAVVVRRFAYLASGPGLWMADRGAKITAVCRSAKSEWVKQTDREALDWERAKTASEAPQTSGATLTHPTPENRSQGQTRPNDGVSWGDVLRDIGSDPQVHPEDGPHRHRWQSVRQAVIMAIRKPGDPWKALCEADDSARKRVESLLERGLVK